MLTFVGFKNPSTQLSWKFLVYIVKLMQNDVSDLGFKGMVKGL
jgi:hypothetical protein